MAKVIILVLVCVLVGYLILRSLVALGFQIKREIKKDEDNLGIIEEEDGKQ